MLSSLPLLALRTAWPLLLALGCGDGNAFTAGATSNSSYSTSADGGHSGNDVDTDDTTTRPAKARSQVSFNGGLGDKFVSQGNATAAPGTLTINSEASGTAVSGFSSGGAGGAVSWTDSFTIPANDRHPPGSRGLITVIATVSANTSGAGAGPDDRAKVGRATLKVDAQLGDGGKFAFAENPPPGGFVLEPGTSEFEYGRAIYVSASLTANANISSLSVPDVKDIAGSFRLQVSRVRVTDFAGVRQRGLEQTSESGFDYLRGAAAAAAR